MSARQPNTAQPPLSPRDAAFLAQLALAAGSGLDPKAIWRAQRAWPVLPDGRIRDAALRLWAVPSAKVEGRVFNVNLSTSDCTYLDAAGQKRPCEDRLYNQRGGRCCHYRAALRKETQMFGDRADRVFAGVDWTPPEVAHVSA